MRLENVLLNNSFKGKFGIIVRSGKLYADNVKIKFTQIKNDIVLENNSIFTSLNNHYIGTKLNTSIYLSENSALFAENNKFIKFKNAIETNHGDFKGKLVIKNIEISHCLSSGIYIHGGELEGKNINISKSASGLIISGNAVVELDQLVIRNNKFFALDIINGANVQIDLFQFDQNKEAGIRASGASSLVNALNGEITDSKIAFISESQATIFGENINLKNGIGRPSKATDGGVIKLSN